MQFMCLLLYHGGELAQYSKGDAPCEVKLVCRGLQAKFNCWYRKDNHSVSFETECFFVKRVCALKIKVLLAMLHSLDFYNKLYTLFLEIIF